MNAQDVRNIWEREVNKESNYFIGYIKGEILKGTLQEGIWLYAFDYNFPRTRDYSPQLISEILEKTRDYFASLGFMAKKTSRGLLLAPSSKLKDCHFTRNFRLIYKERVLQTKGLAWEVYQEIINLIKETALKDRNIQYKISINKPNQKTLHIKDVEYIIENLKGKGFTVELKGLEKGRDVQEEKESIFLEEKNLTLSISW